MSLATWWKVARPFTLSATLSPLLVGSAAAGTELARNSSPFRTGLFLCALLSCLFLQIAANYFNEYFDWRYGLDSEASLGASTVIFRGEMTSRQVLGGGIVSVLLAIVLAVFLVVATGPRILLFGLAGIVVLYFYSAKPFQFSARGLGDVMVFLAMGVLTTWGAFYVQCPHAASLAFAASVPVGCLCTAILNMNNTRDYEEDAQVAKKTLPVRFGRVFGQRFHAVLVGGAFLSVLVFWKLRLLPWECLLVLGAAPYAWRNVRQVLKGGPKALYMVAIRETSLLHLLFGALLAAGLFLHARFGVVPLHLQGSSTAVALASLPLTGAK